MHAVKRTMPQGLATRRMECREERHLLETSFPLFLIYWGEFVHKTLFRETHIWLPDFYSVPLHDPLPHPLQPLQINMITFISMPLKTPFLMSK